MPPALRRPAVAGMFYAEDPADLRAEVEGCFRHPLGPGAMPAAAPRARGPRALVVPHAGLRYSGPVAAHAYGALAAAGLPEAVVIVGPSHAGLGGLGALSALDWATPVGPVRQHGPLRSALEGGILQVDDAAHEAEHSIEVQLPFLKVLADRAGRDVAFVPVAMGLQDEVTAEEVGDALAAAVRATGLDAVLVASSDLMHAGPNYRVRPPPGLGVDEHARRQDAHALRAIEALDPARLLDEVRRREITMCGAGPVAAVLHAATRLGARSAEVLAHATSFDIEPHHSCVGYAAVAVR